MAAKDKTGLTPAQERYCRARAAGMSQADAHKVANKDSVATRETHRTEGAAQERIEAVRRHIEELREQARQGAVMELREIQADLARIASDTSKPDGVRLKAYDQLTRMQGGYTDGVSVQADITVSDRREALRDILPPP